MRKRGSARGGLRGRRSRRRYRQRSAILGYRRGETRARGRAVANSMARHHPHPQISKIDVRVCDNRFIINDTYRSELCLLYPPHMIAIAAIYLTLVLNDKTREAIQAQTASSTPTPTPRRSSRTNSNSAHRKPLPPVPQQQQDFVGFMAGLRVSLPTVAMIAQEILSLYTLWERYSDAAPESGLGQSAVGNSAGDDVVTPAFLTQLLLRMREARLADLAHPASAQPMAVNKRLGRTQAAG